MQIYLGPPTIGKVFLVTGIVKKYLLWNAVTVDKGHHAGRNYDEVHRIFESIIRENGNSISPPNQWFGRGDKNELIVSKPKQRGFWVRIFDKIFGYEPPIMELNSAKIIDNQVEENKTRVSGKF